MMSTQRVSSIKIPPFDKDNYNPWKRKMTLFLRTANPEYQDILKNGITTLMDIIPAHIDEGGVQIPLRRHPKKPSKYIVDEKELASLETSLQLILIESLDPVMYNHVVNCTSAKQIWDTIEVINEGTKEVRENSIEIMTSQYEHFKSLPDEGISEVFERYNKLINDLNLHEKYYTRR